jgi:hypothetical protein
MPKRYKPPTDDFWIEKIADTIDEWKNADGERTGKDIVSAELALVEIDYGTILPWLTRRLLEEAKSLPPSPGMQIEAVTRDRPGDRNRITGSE